MRKDQHIWYPFTQMKTAAEPLEVASAKDSVLTLSDGREVVDLISSWWVNVHGHGNEHMAQALTSQFGKLDHTIFAGFTHEKAIELSTRIIQKLGEPFNKVFFSDDGSTSVEVALKMALQYWKQTDPKRRKIVAFNHAYHGDTFGAMAVGERGPFNEAFHHLLFDVIYVDPPTPGNERESLTQFMDLLEKRDVAAFIYEPLILGAGGMLMYDSTLLDKFLGVCKYHGTLAIADEVMVGFGRTGKMFAQEHTNNKADIVCLSKGLTGGVLPMSLTVVTDNVYEAFLSDDHSKTFFHGHSFTGNALACAVSCASLDLFDRPETWDNINRIVERHNTFAEKLCEFNNIENVRQCGTVVAFDVVTSEQTSYFNSLRDQLYDHFLGKGLLIRPLGNTLYLMPPYCTSDVQLGAAYQAIFDLFGK